MNKPTLFFLCSVLLFGVAVAAGLWLQHSEQSAAVDDHNTNNVVYFDDNNPVADPLLLGKWTNTDNRDWHKVYYDDYDGNGRFWGKEWDESEDVLEEDLYYHGNGWFRWERRVETLFEYYTMDSRDVPIAHRYILFVHDSTDIEQMEVYNRSVSRFVKQ